MELLEFTTWPSLISLEAHIQSNRDGLTYKKTITVKPDGFLHLRQHFPDRPSRELRFFLEVDRSSESQSNLLEKAMAYQHFTSQERNYFRVLFVFQTAQRLHQTHQTFSRASSSLRKLPMLKLQDLL